MIKLLILDRNENLNINKNEETFIQIARKLHEESNELVEALTGYNQEHIVEEALDVIQVTINLLDRLSSRKLSLEKQINLHNMKLIGRGWTVKKEFEVKQI